MHNGFFPIGRQWLTVDLEGQSIVGTGDVDDLGSLAGYLAVLFSFVTLDIGVVRILSPVRFQR